MKRTFLHQLTLLTCASALMLTSACGDDGGSGGDGTGTSGDGGTTTDDGGDTTTGDDGGDTSTTGGDGGGDTTTGDDGGDTTTDTGTPTDTGTDTGGTETDTTTTGTACGDIDDETDCDNAGGCTWINAGGGECIDISGGCGSLGEQVCKQVADCDWDTDTCVDA